MATRHQLRQTSNIQLPDLVRCNQCKIKKQQSQYSAKRLEDLRKYIIQAGVKGRDFQPSSTGFIRCTLCVGGPATEHECYHCNITFPRNVDYFSKNMLKNNKDEALCWSCSERQQNDTLSSDESEEDNYDDDDSGHDSDGTNPFRGADVGNLLNITDHSSGGVPVNSSGGTIYGGGSSVASRSTTTRSASEFPDAPKMRNGTDTTSMASSITTSKGSFNPNGNPGRLSHAGSAVSSNSPKSKSNFLKVSSVPTKVHSDASRLLQQGLKKKKKILPATKYDDDDDDVEVADSPENSEDERAPSTKATARRVPAKGTIS